jgi:hypothetical protein
MEDKLDTFRSIPIQYGLKKIVGEYQELFNQFLSSLDSLVHYNTIGYKTFK